MAGRQWRYGAFAAVVLGLGAMGYVLAQAEPAPVPTSRHGLAAAVQLARLHVPGQVLAVGPTTVDGQPAWMVRLRGHGGLWVVTVATTSGQVRVAPISPSSPTPVSIAAADQAATGAVPHSVVSRTTAAVVNGHAVYDVVVTVSDGADWMVAVSRTSGAIVSVQTLSTPGPGISATRADQLAVAAVGGGQAIRTQRSEPTDAGGWHYDVTVLLPTSTHMVVTVSQSGTVTAVHPASGS
ncbi:MAG: hypothetical protein M0Z54_16910 [Thermaerobacter sp.]|nr:hypothetical protein [Thermaerobacter sp.]